MKLNETRPYLEISGGLEEQFFSIQDTGMIFDILRNKMYSNPILAITREISCNARDAHREVGKADVPIEIHLPNSLEPEYRIKDFGPGISPDRMSNIFIKYTASTKRADNIQTGGFGLGAKTPFSYSDAFSIITIHNGVRYLYNCLIDDTKVGKLMLADESPTTEQNGTEIIIPVLSKNFKEFATWTEQACRHWDVKPIIKGGQLEWQNLTKILEGNGWAITANHDNYNRSAKMVIDGIEYPLDLYVLRKYADSKLIDSARGNFVMYFGVGELTLSASREQIYLDEKTQNLIKNRLAEIQKDLKQIALNKIAAFQSYWEANIYYRRELNSIFNNLKFLGQLHWNNIPISDETVYTQCPTFHFTRGKYSRKYGTDHNKLSRSSSTYILFEPNTMLFVNDLPIKEPTPRHVKKAFEDNPQLQKLQVICPNDKITQNHLNNTIYLDKMLPQMLSSITKASARAHTPATSRLLVFKFDKNAHAFRQVSYASIDEDTNQKVLCLLTKKNYPDIREPILSNKNSLSLNAIKTLEHKFPNISVYGVDADVPTKRIEEDFSDFVGVEEFIIKNIIDNKAINYTEIKYALDVRHELDERAIRAESKILALIKDPNSLYVRRLRQHLRIKEMATDESGLLDIYEQFNGVIQQTDLEQFKKANPEFDLEKMDDEFKSKYPLMDHIQSYYYSELAPHIAHYINLVDKE